LQGPKWIFAIAQERDLISTAEIAEYAEGNLHQFLPARFFSALSACSAVKCFGSDFAIPRAAGSLTGRTPPQPTNTTPEPIPGFHKSGYESA
jgi:hypothetical protein